MATEVRLAGGDGHHAMLDTALPPRVRLRVQASEERADDALGAARAIVFGMILGGAVWVMIIVCIWLIAR